MAEVFLARRRGAAGIAKRLVVKRVRHDLTSDPRFAELFLREARVSTALSHKNVVTVFDVGRDDDGLFLAMELVDGPDLGAALHRTRELDRRFDPLLAAHIAAEVAGGLDYAHRLRDDGGAALGLVHRDVTPRNILLSLGGEVKVTDFGVAASSRESSDERRGTVPYMSPEQAKGQAVDARSDLYALGLVLFELLGGRRAYDGTDRDSQLAQAREAVVPPLPDEVPRELAEVVARATAREPEARFAGARAMQRALATWVMAERGRRGQAEPLEHALAGFLAEMFPRWREQTGKDLEGRSVGMAGTATLQSVAETVAGDALEVEDHADQGGAVSDGSDAAALEPAARGRRGPAGWVLALGGLALGIAVAGGVGLWRSARTHQADRAPSAAAAGTAAEPTAVAPTPVRSGPSGALAVTGRGDAAASVADAGPGTAAGAAAGADHPQDGARAEDAGTATGRGGHGAHRSLAGHPISARVGAGTLDLNAVPWAYVSNRRGAREGDPGARDPTVGRAPPRPPAQPGAGARAESHGQRHAGSPQPLRGQSAPVTRPPPRARRTRAASPVFAAHCAGRVTSLTHSGGMSRNSRVFFWRSFSARHWRIGSRQRPSSSGGISGSAGVAPGGPVCGGGGLAGNATVGGDTVWWASPVGRPWGNRANRTRWRRSSGFDGS